MAQISFCFNLRRSVFISILARVSFVSDVKRYSDTFQQRAGCMPTSVLTFSHHPRPRSINSTLPYAPTEKKIATKYTGVIVSGEGFLPESTSIDISILLNFYLNPNADCQIFLGNVENCSHFRVLAQNGFHRLPIFIDIIYRSSNLYATIITSSPLQWRQASAGFSPQTATTACKPRRCRIIDIARRNDLS